MENSNMATGGSGKDRPKDPPVKQTEKKKK